MKALVYTGDHAYELKEVEKPKIEKSTDAVVKIIKTTICGSDLGILKGKNPEIAFGTILGHEGVGEVVETGSSVTNFKVGDKVIISCMTSCGSCKNCKNQMYAHCEHGGWQLGHFINGTQAEYVRIPHANNSLTKLPNSIDTDTAVLLSDILPTGLEIGVLMGQVQPGDDVVIVGGGPIGLAALLGAQFYSPGKIILVDLDENRLAFAKTIGATHTINSGKEDVIARVKELTEGEGVNVAIEAVGIPETLQLCTALIRPGGHVANVGVHGHPVEIAMQDLWIKNITISMGLVNTNSIPKLIKAIESKKIDPKKLITHHFKINELEKAYATFINASKEKAIKVVIEA